jgi:hypothetical protein
VAVAVVETRIFWVREDAGMRMERACVRGGEALVSRGEISLGG